MLSLTEMAPKTVNQGTLGLNFGTAAELLVFMFFIFLMFLVVYGVGFFKGRSS